MTTLDAAPVEALVASTHAAHSTRPTPHQLHLAHLHRLHLLHLLHLHTLHLLHLQTLANRRKVTASRTWVRASVRSRIVAAAERYKGRPYSYGNLDCSGLTQRAYRGVKALPRTAAGQQRAVRHVRTPLPGDLVFYGSPAYHVAIYVRQGWMIVARHTGTVVQEQRIWGSPTYGTVLT